MAGLRAKRRAFFLAAAVAVAAPRRLGGDRDGRRGRRFDGRCAASTTKSTYQADQGEIANFVNPSSAEEGSHNVIAKDKLGGKPLFRSRTVGRGKTVPIEGMQYLPAGTYKFICSIHPDSMKGSFVISNKGTPVARPKIKVSIPAQTLNKVRGSGKLKVKVNAVTKSTGISIQARKGIKVIGKMSGLTLPAGATRTVKVALTARGRKALQGVGSAAVSATGSVPFGLPAAGRRTLR